MSSKVKGNIMLLITAIIWGSSFVAQKKGMDHLGPFSFNFARNVLSTIFLFILAKIWPKVTKAPKVEESEETKKTTLIGGIFCGIALATAMSFQQIGLMYTTAGKGGFITALYIVFVPLTGLFLGKKVPLKIWISVVIAAIGLYLLSIQKGFTISKGDFYVLLCSFAYTAHILVIDRFSPRTNGIKLSAVQFATATVISGVIMLFTENITWAGIQEAIVPIAYAGILSSGVGFTLQIIAQKDTDPTVASLLISLESVFSVIAGAIILKEVMSIREIVGCIIMFAAIILAQLPGKRVKGES